MEFEQEFLVYLNSFSTEYKILGIIILGGIFLSVLWSVFRLAKILYLKIKQNRGVQFGIIGFSIVALLVGFKEQLGINGDNMHSLYIWLLSLDWWFLSKIIGAVLGTAFLILFIANTWDIRTKILLFLLGGDAAFAKSNHEKKLRAKLKKEHQTELKEFETKLIQEFNEQLRIMQEANEQLEKKLAKAMSNKPPSPYDVIDDAMEKIEEIQNKPNMREENKAHFIQMIQDSIENITNSYNISMSE